MAHRAGRRLHSGGLYFHDLYENYRIPSRTILLQQFCLVLGIAFLLQALLSYGRWDIILPRRIMVWGSALILILGPSWRILFTDAVWQAVGAQRLLFHRSLTRPFEKSCSSCGNGPSWA